MSRAERMRAAADRERRPRDRRQRPQWRLAVDDIRRTGSAGGCRWWRRRFCRRTVTRNDQIVVDAGRSSPASSSSVAESDEAASTRPAAASPARSSRTARAGARLATGDRLGARARRVSSMGSAARAGWRRRRCAAGLCRPRRAANRARQLGAPRRCASLLHDRLRASSSPTCRSRARLRAAGVRRRHGRRRRLATAPRSARPPPSARESGARDEGISIGCAHFAPRVGGATR